MPVDATIFTHDQDRATLQALKAIPGFTQLLKAFMKVWNERQFRIQNMSTNLRINEKMLPQYYNMLPPICEKLGIEVPELYMEMNVVPNAYTAGDTKPFIVMTSGLIKCMPPELIPTVLAHECGHIACHHVLYHTMGQLILNNAVSLLGLNELITLPLQIAFYHWMRCSEFSADRAATVCDGTSDKIVEMCMRFAGLDKDIEGLYSKEVFLEQALEYRDMLNNSAWNKTLEFMMFMDMTHPLNAVRAYECDQWGRSVNFERICNYLNDQDALRNGNLLGEGERSSLPIAESAKEFVGRNHMEVMWKLQAVGFTNIQLRRVMVKNPLARIGQVMSISVGGRDDFTRGGWYPADVLILIYYYEPATAAEIAAAHPGQVSTPDGSLKYLGRQYQQVMQEFADAGFTNVIAEPARGGKLGWLVKEGTITRITVGGRTSFDRMEWFQPDVPVRISYFTAKDGLTPAPGQQ